MNRTTNANPESASGSPQCMRSSREALEHAHKASADVTKGIELEVLVPKGNERTYTYDGLDICAARMEGEVSQRAVNINGSLA